MTCREERDLLRAALVGVVGVDGRRELEQLEATMRVLPAPAEDEAVLLAAIHALLRTLPDGAAGGVFERVALNLANDRADEQVVAVSPSTRKPLVDAVQPLRVPVWKCNACGCLWRDNLDQTVSLLDADQKSCARCEGLSTQTACAIYWLTVAGVSK